MREKEFLRCSCGRCQGDDALQETHRRWLEIISILNERQKRLYVAEQAFEMGHGGIALMARVSELSERTIRRGMQESRTSGLAGMPERARKPGATAAAFNWTASSGRGESA